MTLFKKIFSFFVLTMLIGACADEPLPFEVFEDLEKGAFARKIADNGGSYFWTDIPNSVYSFTVEFYDENDGANVESFDWTVRYRNNANEGATTDAIPIGSVSKSGFGTDAVSGLPTATYSWPLPDVLAAMGIAPEDTNPGDDIIFDGTITLSDGRTFSASNSGPAINGGAGFDGFFRLILPLICPSDMDGEFDAETVGWCGDTYTGKVKFETDSPGNYKVFASLANGDFVEDYTMGAYLVCYGESATLSGGDVRFSDACEKASFSGEDRWNETFTINNLTVNGKVLVIDWSNSYAPEAGVTTLTRTDDKDWPPLFF